MYMQQQQPMLSTQDFNMAAEIDSHNADVYHHRGQVRVIGVLGAGLSGWFVTIASLWRNMNFHTMNRITIAKKCYFLP